MNIAIVMPGSAAARSGNQHTAQRWARFLRAAGHSVHVAAEWKGTPDDMLIALHARKSHASAAAFHARFPRKPLIVALTGTDLYRDIRIDADAQHSLQIASRLIVLQENGHNELEPALRRKTRVVFQSADVKLRHAPLQKSFRIAVLGHLREEKDPFRAVAALALLPQHADLHIVQIGGALSPAMRKEALAWMRREPRYRWLDSLPHHRALRWLAGSDLMVVSSVMEGGANVICEAARIGVPVLASRISGNTGMLGKRYPGYFDLHDTKALAALIDRAMRESRLMHALNAAVKSRRHLFSPASEWAALRRIIAELAR